MIDRRKKKAATPEKSSIDAVYGREELDILERIADQHGVPAEAIVKLVELELGFHKMGRRRGLFPAMREVVAETATRAP